MSIQLIPKLFSSFQQFVVSGYGPHWVTNWANRELNMMELFFNNVTNFVETLCKGDDVASNSLYSPIEEVQARLQFLSSVFSCELSQHDFSKLRSGNELFNEVLDLLCIISCVIGARISLRTLIKWQIFVDAKLNGYFLLIEYGDPHFLFEFIFLLRTMFSGRVTVVKKSAKIYMYD